MLWIAAIDEFGPDRDSDLAGVDLVAAVRDRQARTSRLRSLMLHRDADLVRVSARIHLLPPMDEHELCRRRERLTDELSLRRYAAVDDVDDHRMHGVAADLVAVDAELAAGVSSIDLTVGRPSAGGADWSLRDLPVGVLDDVARCHATLRIALVDAVTTVIDSELLAPRAGVSGRPADVDLVDHDPDSVGRVRAFVDDVSMIADIVAALHRRMHVAVLRRAVPDARELTAVLAVRRLRARDASDRSRALHAALADVATAAQLTE